MDNRRLSARAETGAASYGPATTVSFLDKVIDLTKANWEIFFYIGLMILAVLTRVWDLGPRALHHDESIHAYYSNQLYKGGGYNYDPTYHGPFLYHIVGLGFFLFGVTDAMARIMPAIFGIALVAMCWWLRPFIGRIGAIVAMTLVVFSPSISYYSRSLRHDIFALTGTMLLFISILWFLRTHDGKWVLFGSAGLAIALTSHELTYIIAVIFILFLVIAAFVYPILAERATAYLRTLTGDETVNPVTAAWRSLMRQRWTLIGGIILFFGIFTVLFTSVLTKFTYTSLTFAPKDANGAAIIDQAPTLPFFASLVEGPAYWLGQHGVARGNQPHFYYLMMLPIYEPLALFAGLATLVWLIVKAVMGRADTYSEADTTVGDTTSLYDRFGVALPSPFGMRGLALSFVAFWAIGALIAFSIAGERLPWLLMQTALPFSLLAAAGIGHLISSVQWRPIYKEGGALLAVSFVLFLFSAFALFWAFGNRLIAYTGTTGDVQNNLRKIILVIFTLGLLAFCAWLSYKLLASRALAVVAMTFVVLFSMYGLRSMVLLNYRHGDVPVEMLVYTQSAPDVPLVADRIKRLSRDETAFDAGRTAADVTGGRSLAISIDQSVEWPFDWYLRDMRAISYFNVGQWTSNQQGVIAPNTPVIIASDETVANANFQAAVKDKYESQKFVLRWWFPEEIYKSSTGPNGELEGDLGKTISWMLSPAFTKYLLYRDPGLPLGSTNFSLFVKKDLAAKVGMGAPAGGTGSATSPGGFDPNVAPAGMTEQQQGSNRGYFSLPRGIAYDGTGAFYVVDTGNFRIQKFDKSGKWLTMFGSKGTGDGQFNSYDESSTGTGPGGIAVDKAGNVYVADTWNHRVEKFDKDGKFLTKWGSFVNIGDAAGSSDPANNTKFFGPRGIAVGPNGNVYVTDTGNKRVLIFDADGKPVGKIDSGMSPQKVAPGYPFNQQGEFNEPVGVAVDSGGNVYVADSLNKRIQKFDAAGKFVTMWNAPAGAWDSGPYLEPFLAVDSAGNVYATAPTSKVVYEFTSAGQILGQKNKQGAITLKTPTGITVVDGSVYVVDTAAPGVVNLGPIQGQ